MDRSAERRENIETSTSDGSGQATQIEGSAKQALSELNQREDVPTANGQSISAAQSIQEPVQAKPGSLHSLLKAAGAMFEQSVRASLVTAASFATGVAVASLVHIAQSLPSAVKYVNTFTGGTSLYDSAIRLWNYGLDSVAFENRQIDAITMSPPIVSATGERLQTAVAQSATTLTSQQMPTGLLSSDVSGVALGLGMLAACITGAILYKKLFGNKPESNSN